ncbi:MAG: LPS-assembly protein LptD [Alphaproteobacteria bacterium]|nr:LPS-assembly protein LptD [Alphaproteobacteria bacterium]
MRLPRGAQGFCARLAKSSRILALIPLGVLATEAIALAEEAPEQPILLEADKIDYDTKNGVVTASGNVEATSGGRSVKADQVIYNQRTGVVLARGNVVMTEADGSVAFADQAEVSDDLRDGVIDSLSIVMTDDSKLAATQGRRSGGIISELRQVIFSPCKVCKENPHPLWAIKADRVVHDKDAKVISYTNATFEFLGVDIAYLPYFEHADPSVKRKSGFLVPDVGTSTDLGYFAEIPYYYAPDPDWDVTIAPFITTNEGQVLKGEYRQRFANGNMIFRGSLANVEERRIDGSGTGDNTVASHLFGYGSFAIDKHWSWGFQVELTSSDTYMERYLISTDDRLVTNPWLTGRWNRSSVYVNGYYFQGLRASDDVGSTPIVLPLVEGTFYPTERVLGGQLKLDGNMLVLQRADGTDSNRISGTAEWKLPWYTEDGQVVTLFASMRGDLYYATDQNLSGIPGDTEDNVTGRVLPMAGIDIRWPFIRSGEWANYLIEPIAQVIAAPYGGNPDEIPNEDSASFEFDDTNLFDAVKFPGLDRWESGPRANVGVRAAAYFGSGGLVEVLAGQNYRLREDTAFADDSGLGDQQSDYVGRLLIRPVSNISIVSRVRLDDEDYTANRNEVYVSAYYPEFQVNAGYVRLNDETEGLGIAAREEVQADTRVFLTDYWSVVAGGRRDLEAGLMIDSKAGLIYEDECSAFELSYTRSFTRDRDAEPNSAVIFRFKLKALGEEIEG